MCYLQNPNVRGSGYIEHPPQVPFGGRVVVQPSTVHDEDVPEWFSHGVPGYHQQQRVAQRVPGQYQGHAPQQTYRVQQQQQQHRAPAPTNTAFTHQMQHVAEPAGAPVAVRTTEPQSSAPVEEKKLSKSAKAKLRKKMREGKI